MLNRHSGTLDHISLFFSSGLLKEFCSHGNLSKNLLASPWGQCWTVGMASARGKEAGGARMFLGLRLGMSPVLPLPWEGTLGMGGTRESRGGNTAWEMGLSP